MGAAKQPFGSPKKFKRPLIFLYKYVYSQRKGLYHIVMQQRIENKLKLFCLGDFSPSRHLSSACDCALVLLLLQCVVCQHIITKSSSDQEFSTCRLGFSFHN